MGKHGQRSVRRTGLWVAAGMVAAGAMLVGFFLVRGQPGSVVADGGGASERVPDFREVIGEASGRDIHLELVDKQDPARLASELLAEAAEPLAGSRYEVKLPQAWWYLRDGRSVHVRADEGEFFMPSRQERPERGVMRRDGLIRVFAQRPDGSTVTRETFDEEADQPTGRAEFDSLRFDGMAGEISTDSLVRGWTPEGEFAVRGLTALANQVEERLSRLETIDGGRIVLRGSPSDPSPAPQADPAPAAPAGKRPRQPAGPRPAPPEPVETWYLAEFFDDVVATRGGARVEADRLSVWFRMLDNRLPEGAIPDMDLAGRGGGLGPGAAGGEHVAWGAMFAAVSAAMAVGGERLVRAAGGEPAEGVALEWSGRLLVRPLERLPRELADGNHVFMRFTAERTGTVRFADAESGAEGQSAALDYAVTTRRLVLSGLGPASVTVRMPEMGEAVVVSADVDLATGVFALPGPGRATAAEGARQLSWNRRVDGKLQLEDGKVVGVESALFQGKVEAVQEAGTINGESLRAEFARTADAGTVLRRVIVEDDGPSGVLARSAAGGGQAGSLSSRHLEIHFEPGEAEESPRPVLVIARERVRGRQPGSAVTGDWLEARLGRDERGGTVATDVEVGGSARFQREQGPRGEPGVAATAEHIKADPRRRTAVLLGAETPAGPREEAVIVHGGTTIRGGQIQLDEDDGRVVVFGPGSFLHEPDGAEPAVNVRWSEEMVFDDSIGLVQCIGEVVAVLSPNALTRDTIEAHRVRLDLVPGLDAVPSGPEAVRRALALGSVLEYDGGTNAIVRSRRYLPDGAGSLRLVEAMNLEGPTIDADIEGGTLHVPDAGRLVVLDHRPDPGADPTATGTPDAASRGAALFDWAGWMRLERPEGRMRMQRDVRLSHRPAGTDETLLLECEDLTAWVKEADETEPSPAGQMRAELQRVLARGAVYARSGPREMVADRIEYEAPTRVIEAMAGPGTHLTMYDGRTTTAVTAGRLLWDLARDRITVKEPGPVVAPVTPR